MKIMLTDVDEALQRLKENFPKWALVNLLPEEYKAALSKAASK